KSLPRHAFVERDRAARGIRRELAITYSRNFILDRARVPQGIYGDVRESIRLEGNDRASSRIAMADDHGAASRPEEAIDACAAKRVEYPRVTSQHVVFIKAMHAPARRQTLLVHALPGDNRQSAVDRDVRQ